MSEFTSLLYYYIIIFFELNNQAPEQGLLEGKFPPSMCTCPRGSRFIQEFKAALTETLLLIGTR